MKQVINGIRFDTETSTPIGEGFSDAPRGDFRFYRATLYRSKRGRYFLAGEGGPETPWAQADRGGVRWGGPGIVPLTAEGARRWAEKRLSQKEIEAGFAAEITDA